MHEHEQDHEHEYDGAGTGAAEEQERRIECRHIALIAQIEQLAQTVAPVCWSIVQVGFNQGAGTKDEPKAHRQPTVHRAF